MNPPTPPFARGYDRCSMVVMESIRIPGTDLTPSALCLGTSEFGVNTSEAEAHALLDSFADRGGTFLHTARVYSDWKPGEIGRSERILGDWLGTRGDREAFVIATMGGHPGFEVDAAGGTRRKSVPRLSPEQIRSDLEASLRALRTDYIDLYYLHRDDPSRSVSEMIEVLDEEQARGRVRHYGCSNWTASRVREANEFASLTGKTGFVANQMCWSIGSRHAPAPDDSTMVSMDSETYDLHRASGRAAIPFSAQAHGLFAKLQRDPSLEHSWATEGNRELFVRLNALSGRLDLTISQIVLAYLWSHPFPVIPAIGCRTQAQLLDSLSAVGARLPQQVMKELSSEFDLPA